jgi:hypothetical protein
MSNEAELCARALARFIHGARVRGVEIRRAGILTGEAEPTRSLQQIETDPSAAALERTQLPAECHDPSAVETQRNPSVTESKRTQLRWNSEGTQARSDPIEPKLRKTGPSVMLRRWSPNEPKLQDPPHSSRGGIQSNPSAADCAGFGRRRAALCDQAGRAGQGTSDREM